MYTLWNVHVRSSLPVTFHTQNIGFVTSSKLLFSSILRVGGAHQASFWLTKCKHKVTRDMWETVFLWRTPSSAPVAFFFSLLWCSGMARDQTSGIYEETMWEKVTFQKWRSRKRERIETDETKSHCNSHGWLVPGLFSERKINSYFGNWLWSVLCHWKQSYLTQYVNAEIIM